MASGAAKRYTQAVFGLAQEKGSFADWQRDLDRLASLIEDERAGQILGSPNTPEEEKQAVIDAMLADAQPEARNLATLLLRRGRLEIAPEMSQLFTESVLAERGIAIADVTTAEPLDAAGEAMVRARLKQVIGKEIELRLHVDPAIIGGIVARVGDQLIDGSVTNQLRRLRTRLAAAS